MKRIIFKEKGRWSDPGYQADVLITEGEEQLGKFRGSTWPNPFNPREPEMALADYAGAVAPGEYRAQYSMYAHNGKPGFNIEDNGKIPTINPNPNQGGEMFADHVDIHAGWSDTWRGSKGCLTIHPKDWAAFATVFAESEEVELFIERRYNEVS